MTDFEKQIYDDLVAAVGAGGWDQATYPATVRYGDESDHSRQIDTKILIEIQSGGADARALSTQNIYMTQIVHVLLTVRDAAKTFRVLKQYLETVVGVFYVWILAKNYTNIEVVARYQATPLKTDVWLRCYDVI